MRQLEPEEREEAIARMLSGETLTEASRKIAKEMLSASY
jgi:DNA repair ATPase RecN